MKFMWEQLECFIFADLKLHEVYYLKFVRIKYNWNFEIYLNFDRCKRGADKLF